MFEIPLIWVSSVSFSNSFSWLVSVESSFSVTLKCSSKSFSSFLAIASCLKEERFSVCDNASTKPSKSFTSKETKTIWYLKTYLWAQQVNFVPRTFLLFDIRALILKKRKNAPLENGILQQLAIHCYVWGHRDKTFIQWSFKTPASLIWLSHLW